MTVAPTNVCMGREGGAIVKTVNAQTLADLLTDLRDIVDHRVARSKAARHHRELNENSQSTHD